MSVCITGIFGFLTDLYEKCSGLKFKKIKKAGLYISNVHDIYGFQLASTGADGRLPGT